MSIIVKHQTKKAKVRMLFNQLHAQRFLYSSHPAPKLGTCSKIHFPSCYFNPQCAHTQLKSFYCLSTLDITTKCSRPSPAFMCMPRLSGHFVHLGVQFRFRGGFINHNITTDFLFWTMHGAFQHTIGPFLLGSKLHQGFCLPSAILWRFVTLNCTHWL